MTNLNIEIPEDLQLGEIKVNKKVEHCPIPEINIEEFETVDEESQLDDNNQEESEKEESDKENSDAYFSPILQIRKSRNDTSSYTPALKSNSKRQVPKF